MFSASYYASLDQDRNNMGLQLHLLSSATPNLGPESEVSSTQLHDTMINLTTE
jgi:hypothetical protein